MEECTIKRKPTRLRVGLVLHTDMDCERTYVLLSQPLKRDTYIDASLGGPVMYAKGSYLFSRIAGDPTLGARSELTVISHTGRQKLMDHTHIPDWSKSG